MIPTLYKTFQHWAENGSVYILSDLHFADSDCKLMAPDWIEPENQIKIINDVVYVYENWKSHTPSKSGTLYVDAADGSSYLDLVSLIRMHGATPKKDMQELWKRVLQQDCMKCQRTKPKRNWVRLNIRLKRIGGNLLDNMD